MTHQDQWTETRRLLLLCSYCGGDRVQCSDEHPCADCLVMCNTFMIPREALDGAAYAGTLPGIVQGDRPLKRRLPKGWRRQAALADREQRGTDGSNATGSEPSPEIVSRPKPGHIEVVAPNAPYPGRPPRSESLSGEASRWPHLSQAPSSQGGEGGADA